MDVEKTEPEVRERHTNPAPQRDFTPVGVSQFIETIGTTGIGRQNQSVE